MEYQDDSVEIIAGDESDAAEPVRATVGGPPDARTVVALFTDSGDARRAIRALEEEGFARDQIGILMRDGRVPVEEVENPAAHVAEDTATGAVEGGVLGGVLGLIVGALAVPGVGPIVAGGTLASALATAGTTALAGLGVGAATGGIVGVLTGQTLHREHVERIEEGIRQGGVVVSVNAGPRAADAVAILFRHHGDTGQERGNMNPLYHDQPAFVRHHEQDASLAPDPSGAPEAERVSGLGDEYVMTDAEDEDEDVPERRITG